MSADDTRDDLDPAPPDRTSYSFRLAGAGERLAALLGREIELPASRLGLPDAAVRAGGGGALDGHFDATAAHSTAMGDYRAGLEAERDLVENAVIALMDRAIIAADPRWGAHVADAAELWRFSAGTPGDEGFADGAAMMLKTLAGMVPGGAPDPGTGTEPGQ